MFTRSGKEEGSRATVSTVLQCPSQCKNAAVAEGCELLYWVLRKGI